MVRFVNAKFDLDKKITFSYARMVFLLAISFSIGILVGMALFFIKNQDLLIHSPQVLPVAKPTIILAPIPTATPVSDDAAFKFTEKNTNGLAVDSTKLLGYWFTPHAATRNITFLKNNQFKFNDGNKTTYAGSFAVDAFIVTLKFNSEKMPDIALKFSEDQYVKYLENNEGELFIKQ